MSRTLAFVREQLRTPFALALLAGVPLVFVTAAAGVLSDFARALGGSLGGDAAVGLSAGWSAAFLAGALGFFSASSSRGADRRLVLAGAAPMKVAGSRVASAMMLAAIAAVAAYATLAARSTIVHPSHAGLAVLAFAWTYLGVGVIIGSLVAEPLAGSLLVVLVFVLDVFSGPGMSNAAPPWAVSRHAADVLIDAGLGRTSPAGTWWGAALTATVALVGAMAAFTITARRRT